MSATLGGSSDGFQRVAFAYFTTAPTELQYARLLCKDPSLDPANPARADFSLGLNVTCVRGSGSTCRHEHVPNGDPLPGGNQEGPNASMRAQVLPCGNQEGPHASMRQSRGPKCLHAAGAHLLPDRQCALDCVEPRDELRRALMLREERFESKT